MADTFVRFIEVSTFPDVANQHVLDQAEEMPTHAVSTVSTTLYNSYHEPKTLKRAVAFRLVPHLSFNLHRCRIPLKITANIPHNGPGDYIMTWRAGTDFEIRSDPFHLDGIPKSGVCVVEDIGPFYAEVHASCPFRVDLTAWAVQSCESGQIVEGDDHELRLYFFLGSAALSLNGFLSSNIHYGPLLRYTIPEYRYVVERSWEELEGQITQAVAETFWKLGNQTFCYDKASGKPSFVNGDWSVDLSRMLRATVVGSTFQTCNCVDLAALIYAAFKSFGKRADSNGQEIDIFDITTKWVKGAAYMPPGRLFGWQDSTFFAETEPFWRQPVEARDIPHEVDAQSRKDAVSEGGKWHVYRDSYNVYRCTPAHPSLKNFYVGLDFNPNDPYRTQFFCHVFSTLRDAKGCEKVIDICVAIPHLNEHGIEEHTLDDGRQDLYAYLSRGEDGSQQFDWITCQDLSIGPFRV